MRDSFICKMLVICGALLLATTAMMGAVPPQKKNVHIELVYDIKPVQTPMGEKKFFTVVPHSYFHMNDVYTNQECKVGSELYRDNVTALDFELNHPLYDEIVPGSTARIPFYVEPGDSLIVNVTRTGKVIGYARKDGGRVKYENLLRHDISNSVFYTAADFESDRKGADFPQFLQRIVKRMNHAVDSVASIADHYGFTDAERRMATNNVKLQFALWIFEFAPYKSAELDSYGRRHKEGWQTLPEQDKDIDAISNPRNYSFLLDLPINDSTSLASKYFPMFIQSYEHAHIFNCDQYLFYGPTDEDSARMDSACVAREQSITGSMRASLYMDIALQRRHLDAPAPDDGSIRLQEVQVLGRKSTDYTPRTTIQDMIDARLNSRPTYNALSPSYWLYDRKRERSKQRALDLIKKMEEEDERERAEREAVMKAYEATVGEKERATEK